MLTSLTYLRFGGHRRRTLYCSLEHLLPPPSPQPSAHKGAKCVLQMEVVVLFLVASQRETNGAYKYLRAGRKSFLLLHHNNKSLPTPGPTPRTATFVWTCLHVDRDRRAWNASATVAGDSPGNSCIRRGNATPTKLVRFHPSNRPTPKAP